MSNSEILTSTGSLGLEERTLDRIYWNSRHPITDMIVLERTCRRANEGLNRGLATRFVARFITDNETLSDLGQSDIAGLVEAVVPIHDREGKLLSWMVMAALNHPSRQALPTTANQLAKARSLTPSGESPLQRIQSAKNQGLVLTKHIEDWMVPQIYSLWQPVFGWDPQSRQVENLQARLLMENQIMPENRTVWFSATINQGNVHSLATAERIDLRLGDGQLAPVIESTEWCAQPNVRLHGLTSAAVAYLHGQVVSDLQRRSIPPVIIAEANLYSGAYFVGNAAGMTIPRTEVPVSQVLVQNVVVNDDLDPAGLRDFVMMNLSISNQQSLYSRNQLPSILEE